MRREPVQARSPTAEDARRPSRGAAAAPGRPARATASRGPGGRERRGGLRRTREAGQRLRAPARWRQQRRPAWRQPAPGSPRAPRECRTVPFKARASLGRARPRCPSPYGDARGRNASVAERSPELRYALLDAPPRSARPARRGLGPGLRRRSPRRLRGLVRHVQAHEAARPARRAPDAAPARARGSSRPPRRLPPLRACQESRTSRVTRSSSEIGRSDATPGVSTQHDRPSVHPQVPAAQLDRRTGVVRDRDVGAGEGAEEGALADVGVADEDNGRSQSRS